MIELPSKDKFGNSYLSYSQISLFLKDKEQYKKQYILKEPFVGNEYTDFGLKVGKALETGNFELFNKHEKSTLSKVTRLDLFERKTILNYNNFYIIGFIDTCDNDLTEIIDYKTGGKKKEFEYQKDDYTQLLYYALSLRQETGITPKKASVEFIRREGNLYKNQMLKVGKEEPIKIEVDISENRLKKVYWETIEIAKNISEFYLHNNKI
jgi:hypothetical protein